MAAEFSRTGLRSQPQRFHGAKGRIRARQGVAEAPVRHLSDLGNLGHHVRANRRRLPLGARQHILAGGFHLRGEILTGRLDHADEFPASGVASPGMAATVAVAARSRKVAYTASTVTAARKAQTRIC